MRLSRLRFSDSEQLGKSQPQQSVLGAFQLLFLFSRGFLYGCALWGWSCRFLFSSNTSHDWQLVQFGWRNAPVQVKLNNLRDVFPPSKVETATTFLWCCATLEFQEALIWGKGKKRYLYGYSQDKKCNNLTQVFGSILALWGGNFFLKCLYNWRVFICCPFC